MRGLLYVIGAVVFAFVLLLALPLLAPAILLDDWIRTRRRRAYVQKAPCPVCGAVLGVAALDLADAALAREGAARAMRTPGLRVRMVRVLAAICPTCGARLRWDGPVFAPLEPSA